LFYLAIPQVHIYNDFMSQSLDLYRLQKIDSQREKAASRIRAIDQILLNDLALRQAQNELAACDQALQAARHNLKLAEDAVQAQAIKIEQNQAALYGGKVKNPKELQDLQHESSALKRYLSVLEDQQLDAMLALENSEQEYQKAAGFLDRTQSDSAQKNSTLVSEKQGLQRDIERLESERQATIKPIPVEAQAIYEKLLKQKRGLAVAVVLDNTCSGCGSTLTPAEWQAARSPNMISYCPTCGRILYAG